MTITTTITQTVQLSAALKRKVLTELRTWEELHTQQKILELAMEKAKACAHKIFTDAGCEQALEDGISIEGFKAKLVKSKGGRLDKGVLITLGVTSEMLDEATVEFDKKPFVRITAPGEKEEDT